MLSLGNVPLGRQPFAHRRSRWAGRSTCRRRRLGRLIEPFQQRRPRRGPIAELRSRTGRRGGDRRPRRGQDPVANRGAEPGAFDVDGDCDRSVGCVRVLPAGTTRARGEPRHRIGGDQQPTRCRVHAVDWIHRTIVAGRSPRRRTYSMRQHQQYGNGRRTALASGS